MGSQPQFHFTIDWPHPSKHWIFTAKLTPKKNTIFFFMFICEKSYFKKTMEKISHVLLKWKDLSINDKEEAITKR